MEKKKLAELLGAIFVAAIFLSSYASFANQSPQNTTSISSAIATYYAVGYANASITGYNSILSINIMCRAAVQNSTVNRIGSSIASLENNGSVLTSSANRTGFQVAPGELDSYSIYNYIYRKLDSNSTACASFSTPATVSLPLMINMSVQGQTLGISIPQGAVQQQVNLDLTQNMSRSMRLRVSALITRNGTVYGSITTSRA